MPLYSSESIVLRKIDYRDADRIVTFLTPDHGKLAGLARGARRLKSRFGPALETLTHGTLIYFDREEKNLVNINHFDILHSFRRVREDLFRSASGQYLAELVLGLLPEREAAPEIFQLLLQTLNRLQEVVETEPILRIFEIRLLVLAGFAPKMNACVQCGGGTEPFRFSLRQGGILCRKCRGRTDEGTALSRGCLRFWEEVLTLTEERLGHIRLERKLNRELRELLHLYFRNLLGREIRSYVFLEKLRKEIGGLTL
ncbi:MAG: DNA repair protein RecO [Deltaproteobacteria bacterium]|nr:DNA repair protein RecO [Deltaproteobacteria bacterium]